MYYSSELVDRLLKERKWSEAVAVVREMDSMGNTMISKISSNMLYATLYLCSTSKYVSYYEPVTDKDGFWARVRGRGEKKSVESREDLIKNILKESRRGDEMARECRRELMTNIDTGNCQDLLLAAHSTGFPKDWKDSLPRCEYYMTRDTAFAIYMKKGKNSPREIKEVFDRWPFSTWEMAEIARHRSC